MISPPYYKIISGTVPQTSQKHGCHQIPECLGLAEPVASKGNIEVIPEPCGKGYTRPHRREGRLYDVRGSYVPPVLSGEVIESNHPIPVSILRLHGPGVIGQEDDP